MGNPQQYPAELVIPDQATHWRQLSRMERKDALDLAWARSVGACIGGSHETRTGWHTQSNWFWKTGNRRLDEKRSTSLRSNQFMYQWWLPNLYMWCLDGTWDMALLTIFEARGPLGIINVCWDFFHTFVAKCKISYILRRYIWIYISYVDIYEYIYLT